VSGVSNGLPIFSDWNEALDAVVHALGGFKKVGVMLRPELGEKPLAAAQWLRDCLNADKPERLNPDQVFMLLRLARAENYHAAKHWMDAELGYEQGRPLKPADEAASLQQRGADLVRELRTITERLERLSQPPLAAVYKI
jgi:hypothetical protein